MFFQMKCVNLTSAMPCLPLERTRVGFSVISQPLFFLALRLSIWVSLLFLKVFYESILKRCPGCVWVLLSLLSIEVVLIHGNFLYS